MTMRGIALLLACLSCMVHGRRVQSTRMQVESQRPLESLAMLLHSLAPRAAFNPSGLILHRPAGTSTQSDAPKVVMGTTTDFKPGLTLELDGSVWKVQKFLHVKPGKGSAFVRSTLKNLINGNTLEKTWKAGESFPDADIQRRKLMFSYIDGDDHVFMDMTTYEEERIPSKSLDKAEFILPESEITILFWQGKAIDVQMPDEMDLVVERKDGKTAIVEGGAEITEVPDFVEVGQSIQFDTNTKKFKKRSKGQGKFGSAGVKK